MYEAHNDRVVSMDAPPPPDGGAPLPVVVGDERRLLLAYIVSTPVPGWDGTHVTAVSPDSPDRTIAIVSFARPYCHMFGPPNDEAFAGHPLASRGLQRYSVSEIEESSWIQALERMNAVHPYHRPDHFADRRHYIFSFHDSTFECVAEGLTADVHRGSIRSAIRVMTARLEGTAA